MAEPEREEGRPGPFDRDTAVRALTREGERASFAAEVAHGWRAGRGPHGGYLAAMILRALTLALDDEGRSPRSLTIHFLKAPEEGPVLIETTIERAGRSLSTLSARMSQDGNTMALALSAFSVPWTGPELTELAMPEVAPASPDRDPGTLIPLELGPAFARYITLQPRFGGTPFADPSQAMDTGGWLGLVEARPLDALALAFFTDALIPTPFMRLPGPAPAPTIDLTVHFRTALPRPAREGTAPDPHELVLARARAGLIHEGFFEEDVLIWDEDGVLLAQSRQLALAIG
ncbi:MAG TPA: thioesterase family protein [Solirubrobacteraceae bacterium]|nr:thioesterase family protein [Solirubrobacteraceae bacterium]